MVYPPINPFDTGSRGIARKHGAWSLCLGAGVCMGVLPSWRDLTRELLNATGDVSYTAEQFEKLTNATGWGFDAWIQTALNSMLARGGSYGEFVDLVEHVLYEPLRTRAATHDVANLLGDAFQNPEGMARGDLHRIAMFVNSAFSTCSVRVLAGVLSEAVAVGAAPQAVLSFNYDAVLETMIRWLQIFSAQDRRDGPVPRAAFRRVTGPAGASSPGRGSKTSFYYLHGSVLPKPLKQGTRRAHDSRDRIIAHESSYINIAATAFSWPQSIFLYHAINDGLIIVGQSLSDPNVRRWLAWSAATRSHRSAPHIWLRTRPADARDASVLEASVSHLGLRIAWLQNWRELQPALANLLALAMADSRTSSVI